MIVALGVTLLVVAGFGCVVMANPSLRARWYGGPRPEDDRWASESWKPVLERGEPGYGRGRHRGRGDSGPSAVSSPTAEPGER